jgi:hypothetical protein
MHNCNSHISEGVGADDDAELDAAANAHVGTPSFWQSMFSQKWKNAKALPLFLFPDHPDHTAAAVHNLAATNMVHAVVEAALFTVCPAPIPKRSSFLSWMISKSNSKQQLGVVGDASATSKDSSSPPSSPLRVRATLAVDLSDGAMVEPCEMVEPKHSEMAEALERLGPRRAAMGLISQQELDHMLDVQARFDAIAPSTSPPPSKATTQNDPITRNVLELMASTYGAHFGTAVCTRGVPLNPTIAALQVSMRVIQSHALSGVSLL